MSRISGPRPTPHEPPAQTSAGRRLVFPQGAAAVTVDLEEWFHVCSGGMGLSFDEEARLGTNVERATLRLFDLLGRASCPATIFVLASVAKRNPSLIRRLSARGHEISSHGVSHERMDSLDLAARRMEIRDSRRLLEDLVGRPVLGFRAAEWSIRGTTDPTLRILAEEGYAYDASVTPVPPLGDRRNPPFPYRIDWMDGQSLAEVPPLTGRVGPFRLPAGGSWIGRLFPFSFMTAAIDEARSARGIAVLTLHPWEFDPAHPTDRLGPLARFVHHGGLARADGRLADALLVLSGPIDTISGHLSSASLGVALAPFASVAG